MLNKSEINLKNPKIMGTVVVMDKDPKTRLRSPV
jgi:hypothetical protein